MDMKIYDKVDWHTEKCGVKKVTCYFSRLMDFLKSRGYLSEYGLELYELRDDPSLSITSRMLTDKGNATMSSSYDAFLKTINFETEPDFTALE